MVSVIARRVLTFFPVAFIVLLATFSLIHLTPGNPAVTILGEEASPQAIRALDATMGLNLPLPVQFYHYLLHVITGNLGNSLIGGQPVIQLITSRLPVTLELSILSLGLSLLIAIPLGIAAALRPNSWIDHVARIVALSGAAVPTFWLALVMVYFLAVKWGVLPSLGWTPLSQGIWPNLQHLVLPVFTLSLPLAAIESRMLRGEFLEVMQQLYVRVARAKGLLRRTIILKHAFRNALLPLLTIVGLQVGFLLSGAVITESIFALPGMGQLVFNAVLDRDYPVLSGSVIFMALAILTTNLVVDILYVVFDPRIRT